MASVCAEFDEVSVQRTEVKLSSPALMSGSYRS
jgi:hypothetical protein